MFLGYLGLVKKIHMIWQTYMGKKPMLEMILGYKDSECAKATYQESTVNQYVNQHSFTMYSLNSPVMMKYDSLHIYTGVDLINWEFEVFITAASCRNKMHSKCKAGLCCSISSLGGNLKETFGCVHNSPPYTHSSLLDHSHRL